MNKFWKQSILPFYLITFGITSLLVICLDLIYSINIKDVLIEANGFLLDVFIFGILLTLYEIKNKNKNLIRNYKEQIEDLRNWNTQEASFRISGIVNRLVGKNVFKIDLSYCYLKNGNLENLNLQGSNFTKSNLEGCDLSFTVLNGALLYDISVDENTDFTGAVFKNSKAYEVQKEELMKANADISEIIFN